MLVVYPPPPPQHKCDPLHKGPSPSLGTFPLPSPPLFNILLNFFVLDANYVVSLATSGEFIYIMLTNISIYYISTSISFVKLPE